MNEDLDGMAKLRDMIEKQIWPQSMDAMEWAVEFNKRFPAVSIDDSLGWFANAIMAGYDTAWAHKVRVE